MKGALAELPLRRIVTSIKALVSIGSSGLSFEFREGSFVDGYDPFVGGDDFLVDGDDFLVVEDDAFIVKLDGRGVDLEEEEGLLHGGEDGEC